MVREMRPVGHRAYDPYSHLRGLERTEGKTILESYTVQQLEGMVDRIMIDDIIALEAELREKIAMTPPVPAKPPLWHVSERRAFSKAKRNLDDLNHLLAIAGRKRRIIAEARLKAL